MVLLQDSEAYWLLAATVVCRPARGCSAAPTPSNHTRHMRLQQCWQKVLLLMHLLTVPCQVLLLALGNRVLYLASCCCMAGVMQVVPLLQK